MKQGLAGLALPFLPCRVNLSVLVKIWGVESQTPQWWEESDWYLLHLYFVGFKYS